MQRLSGCAQTKEQRAAGDPRTLGFPGVCRTKSGSQFEPVFGAGCDSAV